MNKPNRLLISLVLIALAASLVIAALPGQSASALAGPTQQASDQPPAQNQPTTSDRPLILVQSYNASMDPLEPGANFNLTLILTNSGNRNAFNIVLTFAPGDLVPVGTGGTQLVQQIIPGESKGINQGFIASPTLTPGGVANAMVTITYNEQGTDTAYSGSFNIALHVASPRYSAVQPTATPTAAPILRPQLAITGYITDVEVLQPGQPFNLKLDVRNLGNADAKSVSVIMGGGNQSGGTNAQGTPEPGGISGGSGEFTNFAPVRSSNIQYLGDIATGQMASTAQDLIVNTSTNPGAYPVKFSFVYQDARGVRFVDDQVITLLVYSLPLVEISFYRDAGPFFVGQPGALPIQIVNQSRKSVVLGNMKASVADPSLGTLMNASTLVSAMDPGGYFTLDATFIPNQPGPMEIIVEVGYTDDFNQPKTITQKLNIDVQEMQQEPIPGGTPGVIIPGGMDQGGKDGVVPPAGPETFWDKVVRFIKGLIGLDSGKTPAVIPAGTAEPNVPEQGVPVKPAPIPQKGGDRPRDNSGTQLSSQLRGLS